MKPKDVASERQSTPSLISLRSTPSARIKRKHKRKGRKKGGDIALKERSAFSLITLKDVTADLTQEPESLEIYPTRSAPTVQEVEDQIAREEEREKLKYFNVPIKIYESDDTGQTVISESLTEYEKIELHRYGSRIMMDSEGHVLGLEVRNDLMQQFRKKDATDEFCQCLEKEYEVSDGLKNDKSIRRKFIARVLLIEAAIRFSALIWFLIQWKFNALHDFLYQQTLLLFFMISICNGTRIASIRYSEIGKYEPCRSIVTVLTCMAYSLGYTLGSTILETCQAYFVEYGEHEDPTGILTVYDKIQRNGIFFPYFFLLMIIDSIMNDLVMIFILCCTKLMDELQNGFILVLIVTAAATTTLELLFIYTSGEFKHPGAWDICQAIFSGVISCKWSMWRFYMFQELLRGKVMNVKEDQYYYVALSYAI